MSPSTVIPGAKKIIRIITFSDYNMSTTLLFKALKILPIDKLVYNRIGIVMFKYENGLLPGVMNDLYITNSEVHSHDTRQKYLLHINKGSINIFTNSFVNTSARVWNVLRSKIDVYVSISKFKSTSKIFLLNNSLDLQYTK